ncbi:serine hydroxymethyltransferase [Candidatus Uhrbacteria bacterium RIFCSPHIGHO2_12_FULL_57_11]|uniref:Serine hydroxymethyltransferase n=2 Tax=Candidatus Uhriibacteriota TaxID=1752732 RepID=A0A1F7UPR3_9BACT|nr:MAG: serine hydroxymethyltransferase [Candidatus Uhrbacteria bacterium RIFCSPHIGHO2_02_FULL_57_19]OGL79734.1 MAG: serine hydroxymethyltransferase [Candidatus Uhrbacteria bacterium RIFCSPHIGHO2_12_FULL_57_11]
MTQSLAQFDPEIAGSIACELARQQNGLEMIPSENFVSLPVLQALGSILTNKYSEGYPGKRYYGGNEFVDQIENLARERAKQLFGVSHANVQPYSGSPANQAACFALLEPGEKLMGLHLTYGGHLTHGWKINFSGRYYQAVQYVTGKDGWLDYDALAKQVSDEKPRLLFVGATAYPRIFDWEKLSVISKSVDAYLVADISHIAGLVIGGVHPSPIGFADVITTTTHKTLRGPRGAMILADGELSEPMKPPPEKSRKYLPTMIDRAVFPGLQGGPHNHQTAAIAVALKEAAEPAFKDYAAQIVKNAKALAERLLEHGFTLVTGGTDNHLLLVDLTNKRIGGAAAESALDRAGITVNKNTIPNDSRKPYDPSGIRLGTPAITSRGMKEDTMRWIGDKINEVITDHADAERITRIREEVRKFVEDYPLYPTGT